MRIAVRLIRQGAVTNIVGGCKDCVFGQTSRQLARFQEDVEEMADPLLETEAKRRRVRKQEQRKNMLDVSNQIQSKYSGGISKELFNNMKARCLLTQSMTQRAYLRAVGYKQQIFGSNTTIGVLVSKLKEETQERWYLHLTRLLNSREEGVLGHGLRLKGGQQQLGGFRDSRQLGA